MQTQMTRTVQEDLVVSSKQEIQNNFPKKTNVPLLVYFGFRYLSSSFSSLFVLFLTLEFKSITVKLSDHLFFFLFIGIIFSQYIFTLVAKYG